MPITIYGIKNCDTMKKARAWLDSHGVAYDFHDDKTKRHGAWQQSGEQNTWRSVTGLNGPPCDGTNWKLTETVGEAGKPDDYFGRIIFDV